MAEGAQFSFEIVSGTEIHVTHIDEGHRYVVTIVKDRSLRRDLSPEMTMRQGSFQHSPLAFRRAALCFASEVAGRAGLIDKGSAVHLL